MACFSQTITLQILDRESGTPVVGAWVKCNEVRQITNENGMVVFASSCQELTVKHVSYADSSFKIPKEFQEVYKFYLASDRTLGTVVIQGQRSVRVAPFQTSINGKYIERFPTFLGQTDAFYILQMQAGVSPSQEGNVGFHVRGGEAFENLIRLDGAVVYNPQHLLGIVTPFNSATINSVDFVKDGIDASNGGKASSFVDFHTRKGNFTQRETRIDVGLVNSGLVHSGYMIKDKLAYSISGRAGNLNAFSRWMDFKVSFSDLMMNMSWNINDNSKLDVTYFQSGDEFGQDSSFDNVINKMSWSNSVIALNYHLKMGNRTQLNCNLSHRQMINTKTIDIIKIEQDLSVWLAKARWTTFFNKFHFNYGFESNIFSNAYQFKDTSQSKGLFNGEHALFVQVNYFYNKWEFSLGNRLNYFQNFQLSENIWSNDVRSKVSYHQDKWQIYAAFDELSQFNYTLQEGYALQPNDFIMVLDRRLGPIKSYSTSLGGLLQLKNWTLRTTLFYKEYTNFMDIKEDAILYQNFQLQDNLTNALKNSYGIETSVHWHWRSLDWFTNYTYSKTMLQSDEINLGIPYPAAFDRPHIFNTTASWHKKDSKWKFGAAFYLMSGRRTSLVFEDLYTTNRFYTTSQWSLLLSTPRNAVSLPTYHRLDLSGSKEFSHKNPKVKSFMTVSIYNVYNKLNVYNIVKNYEYDGTNSRFLSFTLFPIIPSASYSVRF
jgi:hypothetical protein